MNTNFTMLLRPAELLDKYAGAIANKRTVQQRAEAEADKQARITALANTFIQLCRKQIAGMNEEDAIRIANGESARPICLYQRTQLAFEKLYEHRDAILDQLNDDLKQLGWRASYRSGGFYSQPRSFWCVNPLIYIRDTLLLHPLVE
jgi:hypothetical protein